MPELYARGWRGVCLIALTYVYFLIFAQFAFLNRLAEIGIADTHLQTVMGAMALGGIAFSLLAGRLTSLLQAPGRLRVSLAACCVAALSMHLPLGFGSSVIVAFVIGSALGSLTVTLVSSLDLWLGNSNRLLKVGLGTGIGYLLCNVPWVFTATPMRQADFAAVLTFGGVLLTLRAPSLPADTELHESQASAGIKPPFAIVLLAFTALVWFDSAAFFIIQNTPALKAGTWQGTAHLWVNGSLHLVAALASAWLLRRRGLPIVLGLAIAALASACLLLLNPGRALLASAFYPVGVSLYSVALVAYPALITAAGSTRKRARKAAIIYAVAGWFGSAMGIGMAQHLGHVPSAFVLCACLLVLGPLTWRMLLRYRLEAAVSGTALLAAFAVHRGVSAGHSTPAQTAVELGRQVYISQGCISCHSQYVRPNTRDVLLWGPTQTLAELRAGRPPLIGNRRQGPDLSQVGVRRSPLWLRAHFYNPRALNPASFMPSYAYLFGKGDGRGENLIAYLSSLHGSRTEEHLREESAWQMAPSEVPAADARQGAHLYTELCATCHNQGGLTRTDWRTSFRRLPPDLATGPWLDVDIHASPAELQRRLTQIVKFGISGTDMPGHEYLADADVLSLVKWLQEDEMHAAAQAPALAAVPLPSTFPGDLR